MCHGREGGHSLLWFDKSFACLEHKLQEQPVLIPLKILQMSHMHSFVVTQMIDPLWFYIIRLHMTTCHVIPLNDILQLADLDKP